jgi:hypothetical protein
VDPGAFANEEVLSTTEEHKWSHMSRGDYNAGVVQLYGGTATKQTVRPPAFDAMFFWADSRIMKKFPIRGAFSRATSLPWVLIPRASLPPAKPGVQKRPH